jgi:hypothetical protein
MAHTKGTMEAAEPSSPRPRTLALLLAGLIVACAGFAGCGDYEDTNLNDAAASFATLPGATPLDKQMPLSFPKNGFLMADGCKGPKHYWVHWFQRAILPFFWKDRTNITTHRGYNNLVMDLFGGLLVWNKPNYNVVTDLSFALAGGDFDRYKKDKPGATGVQQPRFYVICLHPLVVAFVPDGPPLVLPKSEGSSSDYANFFNTYDIPFGNREPALSGLTEAQARKLTCRKIAVLILPHGWSGGNTGWREYFDEVDAQRVFITFRKPRTVYSIIVSQPWKRLTDR